MSLHPVFWFTLLLTLAPGLFAQAPAVSLGYAGLYGTDKGLYGVAADGRTDALWTAGEVWKISAVDGQWAILGDQGILVSRDLRTWESRNEGLPTRTIKVLEDGKKSFVRQVQNLEDLERDPQHPSILVSATKDGVFLSRDAGLSWKSLGLPTVRTNGLKAVAVASLPELTVFVSHGIYGVYYLQADRAGAVWTELNRGLEKLESTDNADEVSDLVAARPPSANPTAVPDSFPELYAAQTFRGRVYRLDWPSRTFVPVWSDGRDFGTVESLQVGERTLRFVREGSIREIDRPRSDTSRPPAADAREQTTLTATLRRAATQLGTRINCVSGPAELSELWLLEKDRVFPDSRTARARGKEGLYLPVNHALDPQSLAPYLAAIDAKKLNMVVVDMKDDYGRLRFAPRDPAISALGRVFNPVDIEAFAAAMKAHGVYLVARIVVFKDPELAKKEGGKYAVWDEAAQQPWVGYYETKKKIEPPAGSGSAAGSSSATGSPGAAGAAAASGAAGATAQPEYETVRALYDERWVDPYAEKVWEYNAAISRELHERGFDEIQFDYIRFPTDGLNLDQARYRWRDPGMDKEGAILSFLSYVRSRLDAPISVDIYGANGWYRTGARTGQEVGTLSRYVDVICPMYYPSHFEQDFLAQAPAEERPYRIYYRGTLRTDRIGRGRIIVRPYVQSFFLNVAYDRTYYGNDYVRRQVEGVRDAGAPGLTYWNNVGRYDEIPLPADLRTALRDDRNPDPGRRPVAD